MDRTGGMDGMERADRTAAKEARAGAATQPRPLAERVASVASLDDPVRRALLELVGRSAQPLSRDEAAHALGLSRRVAAAHLDRLADEGLLAVEFRRLTGRTGPGAGRPAKLYRRAAGEVAVTVPERRYDLAGELLAAAIEEAARTGEPVKEVLGRLAREAGRDIGAAARAGEAAATRAGEAGADGARAGEAGADGARAGEVGAFDRVLEEYGFEPREDADGSTVLGNCPFHRLAQRHTEIVCGLNLDLLHGVAEGAGEPRTVVLDPGPGRCCVRALPPENGS